MTHGLLRVTLMLGTVGVSIGAVAWTAEGVRGRGTTPQSEARPECPHDTIFWGDSSHVVHTLAQIPLSGEITGIPEFHDCQRFINKRGGYDSLFAIYAAFHLESLPCGLSRCGVGTATAVGIPAATILSYGGYYPWLGIRNGFNCLYLWNPPDWKAAMIPQSDNPDCRYRRTVEPLPPEAVPLTVQAIAPVAAPPFRDREYPPVARWDWDQTSRQQFIGIRCGMAWCEVGRSSAASTAGAWPDYPPPDLPFEPIPGLVASTASDRAVWRVKGWFDAQALAIKVLDAAAGQLRVRPSPVWGFIVPNPVLGDLQNSNFQNTWVHVAYAIVNAKYSSSVLFGNGRNRVWLCYGTSSSCGVQQERLVCQSPPPPSGVWWWAKIRTQDDSVYRCVTFRGYPSYLDVPGTVRWRWQADDETVWIKCPSGCCELK